MHTDMGSYIHVSEKVCSARHVTSVLFNTECAHDHIYASHDWIVTWDVCQLSPVTSLTLQCKYLKTSRVTFMYSTHNSAWAKLHVTTAIELQIIVTTCMLQ